VSERPWPAAEDPDEEADWAIDFDDSGAGTAELDGDAPLIVFVHIQKTAGKTLRHILRRLYAGPGRSVHVPNFFAKPELHWSAVAERTDDRPPGHEVAHGHMLFEPDRWPRDARFLTILRDPVERTISHYYWLNERRGARSGWDSIEEALDQGAIRDNLQVRVIAGADPAGPVTATMTEDAIAALDRFSGVGLTERFDESLVLFRRALGWRTTAYERVNSTNSRAPRTALDDATIERIQEHTRFDQLLYDVAAERFDELVRGQPDDFHVEVGIVRAAVARIPVKAAWPEQPVVLSTDDVDARALVVNSEGSRLAAEFDRQRLIEATRQIAFLRSELESRVRVPGGYADHYLDQALRTALARIEQLETAQEGARQKIARARKRLRNSTADAETAAPAPDAAVDAPDAAEPPPAAPADADVVPAEAAEEAVSATPKKKQQRPREPDAARRPKAAQKKVPRAASAERTPKASRAERPKATRPT
jgi:hypothetical protein